jgi:hypothetical protein
MWLAHASVYVCRQVIADIVFAIISLAMSIVVLALPAEQIGTVSILSDGYNSNNYNSYYNPYSGYQSRSDYNSWGVGFTVINNVDRLQFIV